jgi:hypothetical protein
MNRLFIALPAIVLFSLVRTAVGQYYNCSLLYEITLPSGFTQFENYEQTFNQTVGSASGSSGEPNAFIWTAAGAVDLNPSSPSFTYTEIEGGDGTQQVGYGSGSNGGALLWSGTPGSVVELTASNLTGVTSAVAFGVGGNQQVGYGGGAGEADHALLWTGSAGSAVDLTPTDLSGITSAEALGTNGTQQVGYGTGTGAAPGGDALLWSGTASSAVDLNPSFLSGNEGSGTVAIGSGEEVGYGDFANTSGHGPTSIQHPMLWKGTAASAVDLTPTDLSGFVDTEFGVQATNGLQQVGVGTLTTTGFEHALVWSGIANSAVDLSTFLPTNLYPWTDSIANTIDSAGNIYGTAKLNQDGGELYAVEWSPVPEPTSGCLMLLAVGLLLKRMTSPR